GIPVLSIAGLGDLLRYLESDEGSAANLGQHRERVAAYRDRYGAGAPARAPQAGSVLLEHEGHLEGDPILGDLALADRDLLVLDPRARDIVERIGGTRDPLDDGVVEALVAGGLDLDDLRDRHGNLLFGEGACLLARFARRHPHSRAAPRRRPIRPDASAETATQQLVDLLRVGLALRRLHHLPDQRVEGLLLAGAELLDGLRVRGQHLVHDLLDR